MFDTLDRYARKLSSRSAGSSAGRARERVRAAGVDARLADVNFANLVLTLTRRAPNPGSLEALAVASGIDAMTYESLSGGWARRRGLEPGRYRGTASAAGRSHAAPSC